MNQNELNDWLQNHPNVKTSESFNLFSLLHKEHDEVRLHSRFISSMLDPNGPHNLGTTPLKRFLGIIGCNKYIEYITQEYTTVTPNSKNWTEDNEIDILIEDKEKKFAIIIENKIFASDSNHIEEKDESDNAPKNNQGQLERYYQYITTGKNPKGKQIRINDIYDKERVEIYYLTLDGHQPTDVSLGSQLFVKGDKKGGTKEVNLIEYKKEICNWFNELLKEDITIDVRSAINQYISLVKNLTGNLELNEKLFEFVGKEENWEEACNIFQLTEKDAEKLNGVEKLLFKNRKHVYWHALAAFFDDLSRELEEQLKPLGVTKVQHPENLAEPISNIIHQRGEKKKEHPYWGFWYNEIWWTMQLNEEYHHFFFGVDSSTGPNKDNKSLQQLKTKFSENRYYTDIPGWHALKYLHECTIEFEGKNVTLPILNPWDFTKEKTFDLLNEDKRKKIAQQYAKFIKDELKKLK